MNIVKCIGLYNKIEGYSLDDLKAMLSEERIRQKISDLIILDDDKSTSIRCIKYYYVNAESPKDLSKEPDNTRTCYKAKCEIFDRERLADNIPTYHCMSCHICAIEEYQQGKIKRNVEAIKRKIGRKKKSIKKKLI